MRNDDGRQSGEGRYQRGVRNPDPALMTRIQQELAANPSISKSELARRVDVSRATVGYYLRALPAYAEAQSTKHAELGRRVVTTHEELLTQVSEATGEIREVIAELRQAPASPSQATAVFKGFSSLERMWRLLGELLGEVAPPQQNTYIVQVRTLLNQDVDTSALSPSTRQVIEGHIAGEGEDGAGG